MKVIILGAGVIGVTTAYFLACLGVKVIVLEKESASALKSSFANGAQLSYSHAEPWATYANVIKAIKWLGKKNAPLLLSLNLDWDKYKWLMRFVTNCNLSRVRNNTEAILKLNFYSKMILEELLKKEEIVFDYFKGGIVHIFKQKAEIIAGEKLFSSLQTYENNLTFQRLNRTECIKLDPALEHLMRKRSGGILCSSDAVGDIFKYTQSMERVCKNLGVEFYYNTEVLGIEHDIHKVKSAILKESKITADAILVAMGAYSATFLRQAKIIKLPIYPMKGYSISVPIINANCCPKVSVTDHQRKIVFSTIGNILRAAGTAELIGYNHDVCKERVAPLISTTKRYFPEGGDFKKLSSWACLRAQTPHSYPYISRVKFKNLYINSGHGSLGWTQAHGSSKAIADLITNNQSRLDLTPYTLNF